mmetsp:Transcript_7377/g.22651  ORF Transcript_7377/g.22651 Transcript_7377/m.22651 type:complete len:277 (+) Transcript_7377:101-931(+)
MASSWYDASVALSAQLNDWLALVCSCSAPVEAYRPVQEDAWPPAAPAAAEATPQRVCIATPEVIASLPRRAKVTPSAITDAHLARWGADDSERGGRAALRRSTMGRGDAVAAGVDLARPRRVCRRRGRAVGARRGRGDGRQGRGDAAAARSCDGCGPSERTDSGGPSERTGRGDAAARRRAAARRSSDGPRTPRASSTDPFLTTQVGPRERARHAGSRPRGAAAHDAHEDIRGRRGVGAGAPAPLLRLRVGGDGVGSGDARRWAPRTKGPTCVQKI